MKTGNSLYGDLPYTVQNGGCGDRGDLIHVTPEYLASLDAMASLYGPPENLVTFCHYPTKHLEVSKSSTNVSLDATYTLVHLL